MVTVLFTAGRFLDEAKAREIMPYVDMISFPLDGYNDVTNVYNGKMKGRFDDTLRCLRMMRDKYGDKEIQALTIVTNRSRRDLNDIGTLLVKEMGSVKSFHWKLSYYDRRGRSLKAYENILFDPYYLSYDRYLEVVSGVEENFSSIRARHSPRVREKAYLFMYPDGVLSTIIGGKYHEMGNLLNPETFHEQDNIAIFSDISDLIISRAIPIKKGLNQEGSDFIQKMNIKNTLLNEANSRRARTVDAIITVGTTDTDTTTVSFENDTHAIRVAAEHILKNAVIEEDLAVLSAREYLAESFLSLEADSIVASLIFLARKAEREGQKLIIGFEADWVPGYEPGKLQYNISNPLIKEISRLEKKLRSLGIDNVIFRQERGNSLATFLLSESEKTSTRLSNVIAFASADTIASDSFKPLRNAEFGNKPLLAAVNASKMKDFYDNKGGEKIDEQLIPF